MAISKGTQLCFVVLQVTGHISVFVNEPRLSDFKQVLNKAGIQAEFAGGVLICNNVVAVRRVSPFGLTHLSLLIDLIVHLFFHSSV